MAANSKADYIPLHQFVCLPNAILKNPPIRHRGDDPEVGLGVFEFAVLGGIVLLARTDAYKQARHEYAFAQGRKAIDQHRPSPRYKRQTRKSYESYRHHDFTNVGLAAYSKGYKRFKLDRPLSITLTRASLLRAAGLSPAQSRQTKNRRELQGALQRLTEPVVKGLPPLVRSIKTMQSGKLRLIIDPKWLPDGNYGQVVWPPPKSGATVLALYLFLGGCRLRSRIDPMAVERLYRRIGIHHLRSSHAERALDQALVVINEHLKLTNADLEEREFPRGVKVKRFENGSRVRFSAVLSTKQKENRQIEAVLNMYRPKKEDTDRIRREEEKAERWYDEQDRKRKLRQAREREECDEDGYYDTV